MSEVTQKRFPIWKGLLFSAIMVLLVFGGTELSFRALDYPPEKTGISPHKDSFWVVEANLKNEGFFHKESGKTFQVSSNSQHLRYGDIPIGRQPETLRIMALGDSTTFGWGVNQAESYPAYLETILQEKVQGVKVEVINGGQPGYTTFQGLHHVKNRVLQFAADIYLFGYIVQDARSSPIADRDQALRSKTPEFLKAYPLYRLNLYVWMRDVYKVFRSARREVESKTGETFRVPLDEYGDNLKELISLGHKADGRSIVFGFPLEVVGYTGAHRQVMAHVSEEEGVPYFDPSDQMKEAARKETLYFPEDRGHANARGCEVIANQVADWLISSGELERSIDQRRR